MGKVRIVMKGDPLMHSASGPEHEYAVYVGDEEVAYVKAIMVDVDIGRMPMAQITVHHFDLDVDTRGLKTIEAVSEDHET